MKSFNLDLVSRFWWEYHYNSSCFGCVWCDSAVCIVSSHPSHILWYSHCGQTIYLIHVDPEVVTAQYLSTGHKLAPSAAKRHT